jgi:hypothetical protein
MYDQSQMLEKGNGIREARPAALPAITDRFAKHLAEQEELITRLQGGLNSLLLNQQPEAPNGNELGRSITDFASKYESLVDVVMTNNSKLRKMLDHLQLITV